MLGDEVIAGTFATFGSRVNVCIVAVDQDVGADFPQGLWQ